MRCLSPSALVVLLLLQCSQAYADDSSPAFTKTTSLKTRLNDGDMAFYQEVKTGEYQKIGTVLGRMAQFVESGKGTEEMLAHLVGSTLRIEPEKGGILVNVIFRLPVVDTYPPPLMEMLGFTSRQCIQNVCSGYIHIDKLTSVASHPQVQFIKPFVQPFTRTGSVTSEGDRAMGSDVGRDVFGVDGSGKLIGVLSDSLDCATGVATDLATDIATGDLPDDILNLEDLSSGCADEGRAMLQIVHDVAPGARLAFRTAFNGADDFAQGILDLAEAGCDVIIDDSK